jgi:hypothetical protein
MTGWLLIIFITGFLASLIATLLTVRKPLLPALRAE